MNSLNLGSPTLLLLLAGVILAVGLLWVISFAICASTPEFRDVIRNVFFWHVYAPLARLFGYADYPTPPSVSLKHLRTIVKIRK